MSTDLVATILASLAVVGQVLLGLALIALVLAAVSPGARQWAGALRRDVRGLELPIAAAIALLAMAGSLYFSEVADYIPCRLCWWQRGFMYPLGPILLYGWLRRDRRVLALALPMALVGIAIAAYHVQLGWGVSDLGFCSQTDLCEVKWIEKFGYITIPMLSLTAFALIAVLLALAWRTPRVARGA